MVPIFDFFTAIVIPALTADLRKFLFAALQLDNSQCAEISASLALKEYADPVSHQPERHFDPIESIVIVDSNSPASLA